MSDLLLQQPRSVAEALREGAQALAASSESPRLDAELLLCQVLASPRSALFAHPEAPLDALSVRRYCALISRRQAQEPLAYLCAEREFWGLRLEVTPAVLIPRPETEHLVEAALERLPARATTLPPYRVLDLGTGSGAIALALAYERPRAQIIGIDRSAAAITIALRNRERHSLTQVSFLQGDWGDWDNWNSWGSNLTDRYYDLIVSNPPYVEANAPEWSSAALHWEPREALVAGPDGLDAIRCLIPCAQAALQPGGWLCLEHGARQGAAVRELLQRAGLTAVTTRRDLAGLERVTCAQRPCRNRAQPGEQENERSPTA
nr:peptide chain release factor N(5)-glutamine methyltransferase [Halorhodospira abdelmalekii]